MMREFWIALRFLIFLPVAILLVLGFLLTIATHPFFMLFKEGRNTIRRFWMSWWHWVTGEISTYDLIK